MRCFYFTLIVKSAKVRAKSFSCLTSHLVLLLRRLLLLSSRIAVVFTAVTSVTTAVTKSGTGTWDARTRGRRDVGLGEYLHILGLKMKAPQNESLIIRFFVLSQHQNRSQLLFSY